MKVLVFGAAGQLGSTVVKELEEHNDHVRGVTHQEVDITCWPEVEALVTAAKPDAVINCAAFHNVMACETDPKTADAVNTFAVSHLALLCRRLGVKLVQISTDYVFPGTKTWSYLESDEPKPLQAYGRSKLAGEYAVLGASPENLVIRTASLFGVCGHSAKGGDFPSKMLALAKKDGAVCVRGDITMSPTYIPDLADSLVQAVHDGVKGVVHMTGVEPATWYDVAGEFIKAAHIKAAVRRLYDVQDAIARPMYSVLRSERVLPLPAWSDQIGEYLRLWNAQA